MLENRLWVVAAIAVLIVLVGGAYLFGRMSGGEPAPAVSVAPEQQTPSPRKPLYYQDPDGKPVYSPTPKKRADGRPFKPVYAEAGTSRASDAQSSKPSGKVLYYRNPMGLPDISRVPKKDAMGMDYIPVHQGDEETGVVRVSPARLQMLGVKTAPVQMRSSLAQTVRATGVVQAPEDKLADVTTKFDVVVEKLLVSTTGATVRAGQPLARVWIDTPDTMMQRGPDVVTREIDYVIALQEKNPTGIAESERVLREYGMPASMIADIRRTGRATRSVTITAPRDGIILEKPAVEGMHFNTGDPLFKIADLSTVWVMTDVAEQDMGSVRIGQPARVSFVSYPGQSFMGRVNFVYPTLMTNTRTGRVRIVLPNPAGALRESMYGTVLIDTSAAAGRQVLVVPDSAIIDSGAQKVVLVVKGQGRFEPQAVRVGLDGDGFTQILAGLKLGQQVVVGANFLIDAESNLRAALQSFAVGEQKNAAGANP